MEYICIVLNFRGVKVGVCVGYQPPNMKYPSLAAFFHSIDVDLAVEVNKVFFLDEANIVLLSRSVKTESNSIIDTPDITNLRGEKITDYKLVFDVNKAIFQINEIQWSSVRQMQDVFGQICSNHLQESDNEMSNGLKVNTDNCTVLHVAPQTILQTLSETNVQIRLHGSSLAVCDKVKTLGVILDSGLTFS
ncbi:hypothetical protein J6590_060142 [Homalodisca vitripennis]|nr:hypothetical protein J6590_060142 [Homalodisca vitripennis]